jgi:hypothetical protein
MGFFSTIAQRIERWTLTVESNSFHRLEKAKNNKRILDTFLALKDSLAESQNPDDKAAHWALIRILVDKDRKSSWREICKIVDSFTKNRRATTMHLADIERQRQATEFEEMRRYFS